MFVDTGFIPSMFKRQVHFFIHPTMFLLFPEIRVGLFRLFTEKFQVTKQNTSKYMFQVNQTKTSRQSYLQTCLLQAIQVTPPELECAYGRSYPKRKPAATPPDLAAASLPPPP
jgi:hypothetical protein